MLRVNFKLTGDDFLQDHTNANCYAVVSYYEIDTRAKNIICWQDGKEIPYTQQEVKLWCKAMCGWGFPVKYMGLRKTNHYFKIKLKNYIKKVHLTSALTILRYLFESGLNVVPKHYFKIVEEVGADVDTFKAMQVAISYVDLTANWNHSLTNLRPQTVLSKEEFFAKVDKSNGLTYGLNTRGINSTWGGKPLFALPTSYKERYKKVIMQDSTINVYVVGGDVNYANWIPNHVLVDTLEEANLCIFTGGEDVDPSLYNEPKGIHTYSNLERDLEEQKIFKKAKALGIPCLGICRGSQFLCVMSGGKLVQHQLNPFAEHEIYTYDNQTLNITSTHHQAAVPDKYTPYKILAWTKDISPIHLDGLGNEIPLTREAEIVLYRNTDCLGIQGHPEFRHYQNDPKNKASIEYLQNLIIKFLTKQL